MLRRPLLSSCAVTCALFASACGSDDVARAPVLALRDPLDLMHDFCPTEVRLLILPEGYACEMASGLVTPAPPFMPAPGAPPCQPDDTAVPDAVVDFRFPIAMPMTTAMVNEGTYTILVRGVGTDEVTMRPNQIIASGCSTQAIGGGETREVSIELHAVSGTGMCGDGTLSPDEQCEDGNTTAGDGCDATCRSEPFLVSRAPGGAPAAETIPAAAWAERSRAAIAYTSDDGVSATVPDVHAMYLSETGSIISTPTALAVAGPVDTEGGVQTVASIAIGGGRFATAFATFRTGPGDVRVRFLDADRVPAGVTVDAQADTTGAQTNPVIGAIPLTGAAFVVFENANSGTGLSGRAFAQGATTPSGAAESDVGAGTTGSTAPAIAGTDDGFLVVFASAMDIFAQRFMPDGTAMDATAMPVAMAGDATGIQDQPAVAAFPDGRAIVVWRDDGRGVRGQVYDAAFAPAGAVLDFAPGGSDPGVAAGRDRFAVAWAELGSIRARMVSVDGTFALNRQVPRTTDAFPVAMGSVARPAVAAGGAADLPQFIVAWESTDADPVGDIQGRLFALP